MQKFIEHSDADPMELMSSSPDCEFAQFCDRKYRQLIHPGLESSLFGNSDCGALPVIGNTSGLEAVHHGVERPKQRLVLANLVLEMGRE